MKSIVGLRSHVGNSVSVGSAKLETGSRPTIGNLEPADSNANETKPMGAATEEQHLKSAA
jgi:hypothetical protein